MALNRIGARGQLTSLQDNSPNAIRVSLVWDYVFQEVLSERDWKFAKTRQPLELSTVIPLYSYRWAWALPGDLLRFVRPTKRPTDRMRFWFGWGPEGSGWYRREDPPFWPCGIDYKVETLTAGWSDVSTTPMTPFPPPFPAGRYLLTNYGGENGPAMITYIQLITDYSQLMPGFVNCLTNRLAAELSVGITEDQKKFETYMQMYRDSMNSAEAQNETLDFSEDESGSELWQNAGRFVRGW